MKYIIRYNCPDCTGIDPMGCFDGNYWYEPTEKGFPENIEDVKKFDSEDEARLVAQEETRDDIYQFDILPFEEISITSL